MRGKILYKGKNSVQLEKRGDLGLKRPVLGQIGSDFAVQGSCGYLDLRTINQYELLAQNPQIPQEIGLAVKGITCEQLRLTPSH